MPRSSLMTQSNAIDVATFILEEHGALSTMKLQKLVYYSQAWSLVWDDQPLFDEDIEAWAFGPVTPSLYQAHRGHFQVSTNEIKGKSANLSAKSKETIRVIIRHYGKYDGHQLSELTHRERPWAAARGPLPPTARSSNVITKEKMAEYYASL